MSWKGVQGGNPEGEERMRGSALSSPMGVPLDSFHEYKKEEDERKRSVRAPLSRLPLNPMVFPFQTPFRYPSPSIGVHGR